MAQASNPFADMTKLVEQFKMPGVDMSAIAEARRKDIQALVDANKAAYEAMQALAAKQTEMMTQSLQGLQEAAKGAVSGTGFGDPAKQTELVRKTVDKALADMKELAELTRNAQADAMAHLTRRTTERAEEIKNLMMPKKT